MDWQLNLLFLWVLMPFVYAWSPIPSTHSRSFYASPRQQPEQTQQRQFQQQQQQQRRNAISPYLDLALCPLREQPWSCARERSARLLDIWDSELHVQWQKLKDEADRQLNATLEKRGYSDTATLSKEKPSTILKKIEIGTNYMKKYLAETMDGFLGREYDYMDSTKTNNLNDEEETDEEYNEDEESEDEEAAEEEESSNEQNSNPANEPTSGSKNTNEFVQDANHFNQDNHDNDVEFVELEEDNDNEDDEELKRPGGGNKRRKNKNKKKKGSQNGIATQAANLLVIQPLEQQLATQHHDNQFEAHGVSTQLLKPSKQKIKPLKQKRRKRKKGGQGGGTATIVVEQEPATDHFGLGLLEELAAWDGDVIGQRKKKHPMKYGRSNGVTRTKKKKKKKAIMKLVVLGSFLKAKIELLLKLLGAHLQIKFFAVALIGLLINIARFWIDLKRGGHPQKVIYVEHAHHQHHYDEHGSEDWNESGGGGGYWKRSLQTDSTENTYDSVTDSYQPRQQLQQEQQLQQQYDPHYLAYRNQWQRK